MHNKIKTLEEIKEILIKQKKNGKKIVQCHGVFDLLHPGHIRHFKEAKSKGDTLVVTVTPDIYVNKGPGRPAFNQNLRLESLASLAIVDYVVLNTTADAVHAIRNVKPNIYVKGKEYKDFSKDVTQKIIEEKKAVEEEGGEIFFTDDIVFSSSSLINKYIEKRSDDVIDFLEKIKALYSIDEIVDKIEKFKNLRVLVVGDSILDEYQYVDLLGQSGKGQHLVATLKESEVFLGGSLIIANHLSQFSNNVTLLTAIGKHCKYKNFIEEKIEKNVDFKSIYFEKEQTLLKKRYILKDGTTLTKLFETYSSNEDLLDIEAAKNIIRYINQASQKYDLMLICDFGNGFMNKDIIDAIDKNKTFKAINTQINSGNRGYNVITHYKNSNFISINEPEIRLAAHDKKRPLDEITANISKKLNCPYICVTRGINGVYCFERNKKPVEIPALASNVIDRIGAGDSFLALSSLAIASKESLILSAFIGAVAAALSVQTIGNKEFIKKDALCKTIIRLLK